MPTDGERAFTPSCFSLAHCVPSPKSSGSPRRTRINMIILIMKIVEANQFCFLCFDLVIYVSAWVSGSVNPHKLLLTWAFNFWSCCCSCCLIYWSMLSLIPRNDGKERFFTLVGFLFFARLEKDISQITVGRLVDVPEAFRLSYRSFRASIRVVADGKGAGQTTSGRKTRKHGGGKLRL